MLVVLDIMRIIWKKQRSLIVEDKIVSAGHPSYARVLGVSTKLLQANKWDEALDVKWRIVIIDDPTVTVYVMPSGQIVVYTGLLEMMKTDDMLAVILGHEMAHAVMGHMVYGC
ncbi:metalloendopeptidase OMA1, mitochondrial-like [Corticium candelabrum]|uniref:metalloendopeptidase OMA1, mitochondrial-like n=1 Tax=Corticium candelabrum TaxID=121492 RepID=UPI002E2774CB|nr:metalloendopeptidase OMA1, mitochondrial-like [Corticium candelabrum]